MSGPYDADALVPEDAPPWADQPRDSSGRFDVPRDPWGRPVEHLTADGDDW